MSTTPTSNEKDRIRKKLDADSNVLPDSEVEDIFNEIATYDYVGYSRRVWVLASVVEAATRIMASAAKQVSYSEGQSSISLSHVFQHMETLIDIYQKKLDQAIGSEDVAVRWGGFRNWPPIDTSLPDA